MTIMQKKINYQVEFYDVDSMNVVWHGNYIKFLEMARCRFLEEINYTYLHMKEDNYVFPIIKLDFKYIKPAFFMDMIEIETNLVEYKSFLKFKYIIKNAKTKEKLSTGTTTQAPVRIGKNFLEYETPKQLQDAIEKAFK